MTKQPFRCEAKHEKVCIYCGKPFKAKQVNTKVCYEQDCQQRVLREYNRRRKEKKKGKKVG